jgi:UDP-N-acetylmuramoylalanine--D-glutamate ligase
VITAKAFAGKHYAVYGLARSGLATVEALLASGAKVTAWDGKQEARATAPAGTQIANLDEADLNQFDSLVVTPGLPLNRHPIAALARAAGLEIIGDIELFARARPELPPHKVVGITGTNGKSTTTALVHHILKTAGVPTTMAGNIGLPILSQDPLPEGGVYVLELSSYQIDLTQSLDCEVAVLLNVTPDHLDRYEGFDDYAASKRRLFEMQSDSDAAIEPDPRPSMQDATDIWGVWGADGENRDPTHLGTQHDWPSLQGPHNALNAQAAIKVGYRLGLSEGAVAAALRTFVGLPHRLERIRERDGVLFVNDSKATNPEAVAPALAAYPRIRWIVGGQAKAESLGETERHLDHVVHAYTIGEAGPMFARLLRDKGISVTTSETLENAVNHAARDSQAGDVVLLSPACASFDQFKDFEQRGDRFRELVGAL